MKKSFGIKVEPKKPNHFFYGIGSKQAFTFNNEANKTLRLIRGSKYTFNVNAPTHPFYFTTSCIGGSQDKTTLMGPSETRTDVGTVSFVVRDDLPRKFYYQCGNHPNMGGQVVLIEVADLMNILI